MPRPSTSAHAPTTAVGVASPIVASNAIPITISTEPPMGQDRIRPDRSTARPATKVPAAAPNINGISVNPAAVGLTPFTS